MINSKDLQAVHKFVEKFLNGTGKCQKCGKMYSKKVDCDGKWLNSMCACKVGIMYSNGAVVIKKKTEYDRLKMRNFISRDMREKLKELGKDG